jgi:putative NIF3 family GTP cyclohydrolase 1 type 2
MSITAQAVVERIQQQLGSRWKDSYGVDTFLAGKPETEVTGIVTAYAPTVEVLKKAVAGGKNLIISRESPYWARTPKPGGGAGGFGPGRSDPKLDGNPTYQRKREYIESNNLVVYRLFTAWNARQPDQQLVGLAKALGWEKYYKPAGGIPWGTNNGFFDIPPATLKETAQNIKKTLKSRSIRVGGDPNITVSRAALSHGMYWLTDLRQLMSDSNVNLLVVGEPQWENELSIYNFDLTAAGQKKGMIVLGQQASEDPGAGEMAAWLKTIVKEVPVEWIPAGDPSWMLPA